jgi:hypothetical protein
MNSALSTGLKLGLSRKHAETLAKLKTAELIQDFVSRIPANFEPEGDTCLSVAETLRQRRAHCIEGGFVAACALMVHGHPPLLMDLQASSDDDDHVVTLFKHGRCWGAISKTNHVWLRWRDPIYRNLRELAMSYFHEYVMEEKKTLRCYSLPIDLRRFDRKLWISNKDNCWDVATACDDARHYSLLTRTQIRQLRRRDAMELQAGKMIQYRAPNRKSAKRY